MYQNLKKRTEGFTIIEVLIVLAIAGLIMLIVFLAVPALQRNSRNNSRNNDAARIATSIAECLRNNNNDTTTCSNTANLPYGELAILDPPGWSGALLAFTPGTTSQARFSIGFKCSSDGTNVEDASGTNSVAVRYQLEAGSGTTNKCVSS